MILLLIYIVVLFISALIIGKLIYVQKSWEPDKSIAKYFLPPAEKYTIAPDRGAIIGCGGEILAMSTPMYELRMDCTVRKEYFQNKMRKILPGIILSSSGRTRPRRSRKDSPRR